MEPLSVDVHITGDTRMGEYLEMSANKSGSGYYFLPFVWQKVQEGIFREVPIAQVPHHVRQDVVGNPYEKALTDFVNALGSPEKQVKEMDKGDFIIALHSAIDGAGLTIRVADKSGTLKIDANV